MSALPPTDPVAINAVLVAARQPIDVICDRWSLALIAALLRGERRYGGLQACTGMANRLLTARLRTLEQDGLLVREPEPSAHPAYRLTVKGQALAEVLAQMAHWEHVWRDGEQANAAAAPLRCRACGAEASARDIDLRLSVSQLQRMPPKQRSRRRSSLAGDAGRSAGLGPSLVIFGDKWGLEVLLCAFFGIRRFSGMRAQTGMAANILADRLERLIAAGVLRRLEGPGEKGYRLTRKGLGLYGVIVAVQDWADAWLPDRYASPVALFHRACGARFHCRPL